MLNKSSPVKSMRKILIGLVMCSAAFGAGCRHLELAPIPNVSGNAESFPYILNWSDCVNFAKVEHPDLKVANEVLRQAKAEAYKSISNFLPDISGSFDRRRKKSGSDGPFDSFTLATSASEKLFSGFENSGEVLRARRALRAEEFNYKDTESRVAFDLRRAFIRLLHAQELAVLRESIAERRKLNSEIVRLRYEAGREHRGSLKRAEANYTEAEFDVREAKRRIVVERNALARQIGGRYGIPLSVSGELALIIPQQALSEPNFSESVEKIPKVQRRKALADAESAQVIKKQAAFWPTVDGSMGYSRTGANVAMDTESADLGFKVNVPLFSGGERFADLDSARSSQREAFFTLKTERDGAYADLVEKWEDFVSGLDALEVRRNFLDAAVERSEISSLQYQDGLVSFEDWDIIEQELVNSRISLLDAERDALLAETNWSRSLGFSFDAYHG